MSRRFGGSGLGLTISTRLVEAMGGRLAVESQAGVGSKFHFTVALSEASTLPDQPFQLLAKTLFPTPILVLENNEATRRFLERKLKKWGMKPTVAETPEHALAELAKANGAGRPFQLALVDSQLQGADGFDVAAQIKNDNRFETPELVMLTLFGISGETARCHKAGIHSFVAKPIGLVDLFNVVNEALVRRSGAQKRLPVSSAKPQKAARLQLKILLAEDNPINQVVAIRLLEKRGHTVVLAETGKAALEAIEKQSFDLVLMDIQMPEMDGLEATAVIRQREVPGRRLPIVAMTANAMLGDKERCLQSGMDAYLSKPLNIEELYDTVERVVPVHSPELVAVS